MVFTADKLLEEQHRKNGRYTIRTQNLDKHGQPLFVNSLIFSQSPYLLQHAHNPVNWQAWNDETFAMARAENKPVFLSIGYSTCHWCHVMEDESFDNVDVAEVINRLFIAIKVDREQRPDLDEIYMAAVQIVHGSGGWPMSVFLTPQGKPFYGGTYFQANQFIQLLEQVGHAWQTEQPQLNQQAEQLSLAVNQKLTPETDTQPLKEGLLTAVSKHILTITDKQYGGIGQAPKFPQEAFWWFLLDQISRQTRPVIETAEWPFVAHALDAMLQGGIYDQLGGGFHRYAVDREWLVPHFEKMLYNQAQLTRVYTRAWQLSGNPEYKRVAEETLYYVLRELRNEQGLFYSATDADSEGEEGKFFVWQLDELKTLLDEKDLTLLKSIYAITEDGNFEGSIILTLNDDLREIALENKLEYSHIDEILRRIKNVLYHARSKRTPPLTDTKIITEWNAMLIASLTEAASAFKSKVFGTAAICAAENLWQTHYSSEGLCRIGLDGQQLDYALLEDYAHFIDALITLYDYTDQPLWLERAQTLLNDLNTHFWDNASGGYFISPRDSQGPMLVRSKSLEDNATICGNSQMLLNLHKLYQRTGQAALKTQAEDQISAFSEIANKYPLSAPVFLMGAAAAQSACPTSFQYAYGGAVKLQLTPTVRMAATKNSYTLTMTIREGWYLQSDQLKIYCKPSVVLITEYPPASELETSSGTLRVYTGDCKIYLKQQGSEPTFITVELQPCDQNTCYPTEKVTLAHWY
ncbi:thioredoxin domain-containing protein [Teredinibacter haidensis]|uniref:thioredoxin domain-containing protein n=1 Tax=Teredinibacter haidensis TaxID=2731755 RepID=UPI000948ECEF|nr:thioredoxin domain-containing protein [Teredinibacter haidensis]